MQNSLNIIPLKVHSQNYEIKVKDDFTIWLSISLFNDFKENPNIQRKELLRAYVRTVYELYQNEKSIDCLLEQIETQE